MPPTFDTQDTNTPYDTIASLYDLEHQDFDDDISLMRNIASVVGDPIIEFGCGSGRVLLPLAADGFRLTGVDNSTAMLERAEKEIDAFDGSGSIDLVHANMCESLPLPSDTFGVGIFSLNGLMHLESPEDQLAALTESCRVLDRRGQLVIDLFNPTPEYLSHLTSGTHLEGSWPGPNGQELEKWSHRTLHPATQTIETRVWYDAIAADGQVQRTRSTFTLRYLHAAELELMLEKAGYVEWQLYGSYDLDPYEDTSERLIVLAERTPAGAG